MKHLASNIQTNTIVFVVSIFLTVFSLDSFSEAQGSKLSGRVVDVEGNPVADTPVFIGPVDINDSHNKFAPLPLEFFARQQSYTDIDGRFTITDIPSGAVYLGTLPYNINELLPNDTLMQIKETIEGNDIVGLSRSVYVKFKRSDFEPDSKVLSLKIQGVTIYPPSFDYVPQIIFSVKPETHIENVVVTIKPRMRIKGRVMFRDSTPVAKKRLYVTTRVRDNNKRNNNSDAKYYWPKTDAEGYFVLYPRERDEVASYMFSVKYMGLVANAGPLSLSPGERLDGLTFTFDSDPITPKVPIDTAKTISKNTNSIVTPKQQKTPKSNEVWIVNPENGHAYKRIFCQTREDAIAQATKEKAHLVTINDAMEQMWLERVFGHAFYWIGLNFLPSKNGKIWEWHNGEPITYQNWLPLDYFSESLDVNERIFAVSTFVNGKWYAVSPKSVITHNTKMAIIEKATIKGR